ncbi:hypothetical protein [Domibacillus tundrae]|uniref:hypothetical protein n=1 Tax=Domibacillus tundrae TaxID=1587527 RepID=UPI000AF290DA|nr:hypothetical protein [Domibacillus tundrae]
MSPREVYEMLKEHHEKTGRVMTGEEMKSAAGKTAPESLVRGIRTFNRYLDKKRSGAA